MSRVLVTGGSGFIGTNLVDALMARGQEVVNLDIKPPVPESHRRVWQQVDIRDERRLTAAVASAACDTIVHLAARTDLNGRNLADYASNVQGVENVIDAAAKAGVRRVLFASSRLVCRIGYQPTSDTDFQPTTPYGESKVAGERIVRDQVGNAFEWAIFRPTSIWGPWFHIPYRNFFDAVRHGRYVHPTGVRVRKSFGYVGNSVHQLLGLVEAPAERIQARMFYLADYEPIEVLDWGSRVSRAFNAAPIRQVPFGVLKAAALSGDLLSTLGWKSVPLTSFRLDNLVTEMLHDTSPLQAVCGSLPFAIDDAVAETVNWMRADDARRSLPR